jgi:hypothetical protein
MYYFHKIYSVISLKKKRKSQRASNRAIFRWKSFFSPFLNYFYKETLCFILKEATNWIILCHGRSNIFKFYLGSPNEEWNLFLCNSSAFRITPVTFPTPASPISSQVCHLFLDLGTDNVTPKDTLWGAGWWWGATGLKVCQIDSHSAVYYDSQELKCREYCFMMEDGEARKNWLTTIEHLMDARHGPSSPLCYVLPVALCTWGERSLERLETLGQPCSQLGNTNACTHSGLCSWMLVLSPDLQFYL